MSKLNLFVHLALATEAEKKKEENRRILFLDPNANDLVLGQNHIYFTCLRETKEKRWAREMAQSLRVFTTFIANQVSVSSTCIVSYNCL